MDNKTRLQYLQAMGIDVWIPRTSTSAEEHRRIDIEESVIQNSAITQILPVVENDGEKDEWQLLQEEVAGCQRCALSASRTQTVFGSGNNKADWMLIGEAPGYNEDLEGKPFVGKAGLLLTEMLRAIGLSREQVFIANIIKCRPPENRDPKVDEVAACADYLQRQIAMVQPKIILALGRVSAQNLLQTHQPMGKLRGKVHHLKNIPVIVIYHPAYLLRSLLEKRKAWDDLQLAMKVFNEIDNNE